MDDLRLDVCMWTKNSAGLLPRTLRRFDEIVPRDVIGNRIVIDEHSEDETASIAEDFGWAVHRNPSGGVASAANEALRRVSTPFFISIEHDILLARNWWPRIFDQIVNDQSVAVSQGIRVPSEPTLRAIYSHHVEHSIDNNIYRTDVIRKLGGFPYNCPVCTDAWLKINVESARYKWVIDPTVVSDHVRSGIRQEATHRGQLQAICTCTRFPSRNLSLKYLLRLTLTSPISGMKIAVRHNVPKAVLVYPYVRLHILQGWLSGSLKRTQLWRRYLDR